MNTSDTPGGDTRHRAAGDIARAFQLIEIECAINASGATDHDAHAFINGLTAEQTEGVRRALNTLRIYASVGRPDAAAIVLAPGFNPTTRELSVALAMAVNFDRKQAMAAATLAAERMKPTD